VGGATFVSFDCLCFTTISNFGFIHAFNGYVQTIIYNFETVDSACGIEVSAAIKK